jgi:hypothetical protein
MTSLYDSRLHQIVFAERAMDRLREKSHREGFVSMLSFGRCLKLLRFAFDLKRAWTVDSQIRLGAKAMKQAVRYVAVAVVLVVTGSSSAIAAGQKICSPVTPDKWRAMVPVPREWTASDCRAFATSVASTDYKLGCIFTDTVGEKYSWSTELMDVSDPGAPPPPPRNCGW